MGMLVSNAQREALVEGGVKSVPTALRDVLRANHARVLDFFRSVDSNFDGCISHGEMAYALHSLGLNASPKEVTELFDALDPDGNGVIEFSELQLVLREGVSAKKEKVARTLTPAQQARQQRMNQATAKEVRNMIDDFEQKRGLDDPSAPLRRDGMTTNHPQSDIQRSRGGTAVARGGLMYRMDTVWLNSSLLRPQTAPSRTPQAAAAARRKADIYDYWLNKHRAEIESHARAVEMEYAEEKRMRRERVAARRNVQLESMRAKQQNSRLGAIERQEPHVMHRELRMQRSALLSRQSERAWSQDVVFLPKAVAAREPKLVYERAAPDYSDAVWQVRSLQ